MAMAAGRSYVVPDDIKRLAVPCLSHRLILAAGGGTSRTARDLESIVLDIMEKVPVPL